MKMICRKDVAKKANVSPSTVSFILNGKTKHFNPETVKLVQKAAKELGYVPNRIAQALKTGKSNIIVLWVENITSFYGTTIIKSIQKELLKYNYDLLIKDISNFKKVSLEYADGIISYDCYNYLNDYLKIDSNTPIVLTGISKFHNLDNVTFDFSLGFKEAFMTIKDCKKIGYISPDLNINDERYNLYKNYIKNNNLKEYSIICEEISNDDKNLNDLIKNIDFISKLDAIYCYNDYTAIKLLNSLHLLNINNIKVIGTDNTYMCDYVNPSLSSIEIPIKSMCKASVEILINRINNKNAPIQKKLFDSHFVERESSK